MSVGVIKLLTKFISAELSSPYKKKNNFVQSLTQAGKDGLNHNIWQCGLIAESETCVLFPHLRRVFFPRFNKQSISNSILI